MDHHRLGSPTQILPADLKRRDAPPDHGPRMDAVLSQNHRSCSSNTSQSGGSTCPLHQRQTLTSISRLCAKHAKVYSPLSATNSSRRFIAIFSTGLKSKAITANQPSPES